ncbi:component of IIS longevity pathway SMK-1-domain-containing protein, partial [Gongronella butleri]
DTLILWTDDNRDEFALSFQEPKDCDEIWQRIQGKQEVLMKTLADGSTDDDDDYADDPAAKTTTLPAPELGNLAQIATLLQNVVTIDEKEKIAAYILDSDYLPKLVNLFESCEDLESTEDLHTLYTIMKSLIMFNSNKLVETIIKDEHIMNVAGMLEYKPDRPHEKANYREVLLAQANMELVVPLNNEQVMTKIRETFRLQYLKDVILARYLSEELAATLQHFTLVSQMDIIDHIRNDHVYLACLFTLLKQPTTTDEQKIKVAECVLQLIAISKGLQVAQRTALFRTLVTHGLFDVFEVAMASPVEWLRTAGVNALSALVEADVSLTRSTLLKQMDERKPDQPADAPTDLMARMLKQFVAVKDPGLKIQYFEVLKMLLESPTQLPGAFSSEVKAKEVKKKKKKEKSGVFDLSLYFFLCRSCANRRAR